MKLVKGQTYTKAGFGIKQPEAMRTDHIVKGELYSFFNMEADNGGFPQNEIQADGFVYEGRHDYNIVEKENETDLHRHIFVKRDQSADFEYIGKTCRERQYSEKKNKAFFVKE